MAKVLIGLTGSIAAYKAVEVIRDLQKRGFEVRTAATPSALKFIGESTLSTITGYPVYSDMFSAGEATHVELSSWGDCFAVIPATANTISKIASGIGDNCVTELALCFGKGVICPAMNWRMYDNPIVKENIEKLKKHGYEVVEPGYGYLACGDEGKGRLAETGDIVDAIEYWLTPKSLSGKKVMVTAGATREYIDPVRFISNPSSGKMGYEISRAAKALGADEVTLISGKTCLRKPYKVKKIEVETSLQMYEAVMDNIRNVDIFISAAAVSDFSPQEKSDRKIKKDGRNTLELKLTKTKDILKEAAHRKLKGQIFIGFAAETDNIIENARKKLYEKNLDAVVANDITTGVFGSDDTQVTFITESQAIPFKGSKREVAFKILQQTLKIHSK